MSKKSIIIMIAMAVVFGAGGFFGGIQYQKSKAPSLTSFGNGQRLFTNGSGGRNGGAGRMGNFTGGQILSMDSKSLTVKAQDGSSRVIFYSPSTQIIKPSTVDASQLTTGEDIIVTGTNNSDGSITAQNIQIRPAGQGFPGQGRGQDQASSTSGQ